ncbi:glycosyltransferase family 2 protein [Microbacterium sp. Sa4CUA7]|uniref:Glycosyltransferase family 2 protein n=1 Tax=Microbacterium pullorum TaxID=2762236 RepID=A0ABR8S517_9MICO|nr:glycosyltransferase family 2 protein [Microbacterium pullorum]MBD7958581.1 glycosyltransferase family 2 protein [Microbacterium pullorum]
MVPVHNNSSDATRAISSVVAQTMPAKELIIVDDASDPEQLKLLKAYLGALDSAPPIRLICLPENVGPGLARHLGAQQAEGEHVAFLDADDQWHIEKLETVAPLLTSGRASLVGHQRPWRFEVGTDDLRSTISGAPIRALKRRHFLRRNPIPTSSIVAKREVAQTMFALGGRRAEDYMALLVATANPGTTRFIAAPLCFASKPPFGHSGEGADQREMYAATFRNAMRLRELGHLGKTEFITHIAWLVAKVPVGLLRQARYRRMPRGGSIT